MFVVVLATDVSRKAELHVLEKGINQLHGLVQWSADIEDADHIFRILMEVNLLPRLATLFRSMGFMYKVLNIYHTVPGPEHPVFREPGGAEPTCIGLMLLNYFLATTVV